ncbi:MAG: DUF881 domain-containing protein [Moorellales bacterium]
MAAIRLRWQLLLAVVMFFLGLMLSVQFKAQQALSTALEYQSTETLVAMWKDLNAKKELLQKELEQLQTQETSLGQQSFAGKNAKEELQRELVKLKTATGLVAVSGPGITVTLSGDSPVIALDLVDLINELWASGAEAIAVNGHRINALSAVGETRVGDEYFLTLDGRRLFYPIVIQALGDPDTLEKGLTFPGGLIDNFNTLYAIYPRIEKHERLQLPPAPVINWRYARPEAESTGAKS